MRGGAGGGAGFARARCGGEGGLRLAVGDPAASLCGRAAAAMQPKNSAVRAGAGPGPPATRPRQVQERHVLCLEQRGPRSLSQGGDLPGHSTASPVARPFKGQFVGPSRSCGPRVTLPGISGDMRIVGRAAAATCDALAVLRRRLAMAVRRWRIANCRPCGGGDLRCAGRVADIHTEFLTPICRFSHAD